MLDTGSNELSRLMTKYRLELAEVPLGHTDDPDLNELRQRVRAAIRKRDTNAPAVPPDIIRKLVSG